MCVGLNSPPPRVSPGYRRNSKEDVRVVLIIPIDSSCRSFVLVSWFERQSGPWNRTRGIRGPFLGGFVVTKLFVGNLPFNATDAALEALFEKAGTVTTVGIMTDKFTGRSRGFGFVEMQNDREAQDAIERFHGYEFQGRPLTVNVAKPREERGGERRLGFGGERGRGFGSGHKAGRGEKGWGRASGGRERRW